jgi:hypothetical protein
MARTRASEPRKASTPRRLINPGDAFLQHAADCQRMAKFTRDPESRETWSRMAQRWTECAERFKHDREAFHRTPLRHRKPPRAWAEH